jgi:hypothetical protein
MAPCISAEEYIFDVSGAEMTNGRWGQSFKEFTARSGTLPEGEGFDPYNMTPDSEVQVEFILDGEAPADTAPVELIWQSWDNGPVEKDPDVNTNWNKVAPYEYDSKSAVFSYKDIVSAYGTDNFTNVYAINIGDTGVPLKVTSLKITNVHPAGDAEETTAAETTTAQTEPETEAAAVEETTAEEVSEAETTVTTKAKKETAPKETRVTRDRAAEAERIAANAPKDTGSVAAVVIIVILVIVLGVGGYFGYMYLKRNKKI